MVRVQLSPRVWPSVCTGGCCDRVLAHRPRAAATLLCGCTGTRLRPATSSMHATLIGARSLRALVLLSSLLPWACCALELLLLLFSVRFQQNKTLWRRFITTPLLLLDLLLLSGVSVSTVVWCALRRVTYDALYSIFGDVSARRSVHSFALSSNPFSGKVMAHHAGSSWQTSS